MSNNAKYYVSNIMYNELFIASIYTQVAQRNKEEAGSTINRQDAFKLDIASLNGLHMKIIVRPLIFLFVRFF